MLRSRIRAAAAVRAGLCALPLLAAGCSPALNWRELRSPGGIGLALLPCKPATQVRQVRLAGQMVRLTLSACNADGQTWALAHADVGDPAQVGPALKDLQDSAAANLGATSTQALPLQVPGATPNEASTRVRLDGRLPDGKLVQEQVAVFAVGTQVFQATVLGEKVAPEAAETFFASLRAGP